MNYGFHCLSIKNRIMNDCIRALCHQPIYRSLPVHDKDIYFRQFSSVPYLSFVPSRARTNVFKLWHTINRNCNNNKKKAFLQDSMTQESNIHKCVHFMHKLNKKRSPQKYCFKENQCDVTRSHHKTLFYTLRKFIPKLRYMYWQQCAQYMYRKLSLWYMYRKLFYSTCTIKTHTISIYTVQ